MSPTLAVRPVASLPTFETAQVWYGPQVAARADWVHHFTADELAELDGVVQAADASGTDLLAFRATDFPMPGLQDRLKSSSACLSN